jgi:hypothetical protein
MVGGRHTRLFKQMMAQPKPNKTDAGNGSYGICRVIDASRSPSPDPSRSANSSKKSPFEVSYQ